MVDPDLTFKSSDLLGGVRIRMSDCFESNMGEDSDDSMDDGTDGQSGTVVLSRSDVELQEPTMYQVILHNDDYTPMEFVILVLKKYFRKDQAEATRIMLDVHNKGIGVCGLYPFEVAETKVALVAESAKENEHPLKCTLDEA